MESMIKKGNLISKNEYIESCNIQEKLTIKFENIMNNYDFLITPSTASVAPKIGESEKMDTSLIWTFFGAPAISLPIFNEEKTKLPFGMQIISSRYNDLFLLNFCEKILKNLKKKY